MFLEILVNCSLEIFFHEEFPGRVLIASIMEEYNRVRHSPTPAVRWTFCPQGSRLVVFGSVL